MGDSAKPWSGNVLSVVCPWRMIESRFPLDAEDLPRYAPNETLRAAEAAPALFASLCGECPKPCDGRLMVASISSQAWYFEDRCDAIKAVHAAWSLLALEAIEIKPDCK